jgi:transcriptional regulator with XRE-family HTH domain
MGRLIEFPYPETPRSGKPLWRHVLGEVLRGERLEQERILTEVAATAGVSPQYLSEVERGRKEASSEVLGAVADALGLELADIVGRVAGRLAHREPERRHADEREARRPAPERPITISAPPAGPPHPGGSVADVFLLAA